MGDPRSLFLILGKIVFCKKLLQLNPFTFKYLRIEAENQAFLENKFFNIKDIYRHFHNITQIDFDLLNKVMEEELSLEMKSTLANPDIVNEISKARNTGAKIAHVSDMYLSKGFIRKILLREGIMQDNDLLYVSNEDKAAKGDGSIFVKISKEQGISLDRISHTGNCYTADYMGAKSVGVNVSHYSKGNLTSRESKLEQINKFTEGHSSYWAGISRMGRLCSVSEKYKDIEHETLEAIACSIASPLLCSYVHWVLDQALIDGVKALFFIARDGQLLWQIAKFFKENTLKYRNLKLNYIHGSRESWRPATIVKLDEFAVNWILDDCHKLTPSKIYQRLGISKEFFATFPPTPFDSVKNNEIIPFGLQNPIKEWLMSPNVASLVEGTSKDKRSLLLQYFEQEGVLECSSAFVEIGCTGQTQHAVHRMLQYCGKPSPSNYFFGLADKDLHSDGFQAKAFFYNQRLNEGFPASSDLNYFPLLESFCMSDHGRTLAYSINNAKVTPITAQRAKYFAKEGWDVFFKTKVLSTAVAYSKSELQFSNPETNKLGLLEIIREFWQKPSFNEAIVWGSHRKEHDPTNCVSESLAKPLAIKEWKHCFYSHSIPQSWWFHAQEKISNSYIKIFLTMIIYFSRSLNFLRIKFGKFKKYVLMPKI